MRPAREAVAAAPAALLARARHGRLAAVRLGATFLVVLIHVTGGPDRPALGPGAQAPSLANLVVNRLGSSLAVPTFLLLAFMSLHPRLAGERGWARRLRARCVQLAPAYLFWVAVYGAARVVLGGERLTPGTAARYLLLGDAAAHLYFVPLLVALTLLAPAWLWLVRRPALGLAAALALPLGSAALAGAAASAGPLATALDGVAGNACYAIAGLALVEAFGGWEPAPARSAAVFPAALAAALLAAAVVTGHAVAQLTAGAVVPPAAATLARVVLPVAALTAVLSSGARVPGWAAGLAPLTFGVYLVHPLLLKPLRALEGRVPALTGHELAFAVPNALLVAIGSFWVVLLLADTRLRRVVT